MKQLVEKKDGDVTPREVHLVLHTAFMYIAPIFKLYSKQWPCSPQIRIAHMKRPRAGLTNSSFQAQLVHMDRRAGTHMDWANYEQLIPPETKEYTLYITKLQSALHAARRPKTQAQRGHLAFLLHKYRMKMSALARDFWETHSLY